ncbi:T4 family baseplate hub assembly chaperone [Roseibium marinum]|uniref:T4 bacteriophage base plate protein n=1 Tax=Roseibium marinum TaxID=281252 RepID=A0A2S3UN26_9HYPH|nr:hypothetical protein [Roseibium marinum]POF29091.1 hypothetical protein CLV41_11095 [Roseibium marinum]
MQQIAPIETETARPVARMGHEVTLPVGFTDEDGTRHVKARIRKLTGNEEAILADPRLRQNTGKLVTELLASAIREIDGVEKVGPKVTAALTSADRNYLLLELRKITFGAELEARYVCPACSERFEAVEDLGLFECRTSEDGEPVVEVDLEDGYEDRDGELHLRALFRLPTGEDEEKVSAAMKQNPSRGVNLLLSRCLNSLGSLPENKLKGLGARIFSDLTMSDRSLIERAMRSDAPGVDLRHQVDCLACGHDFEVNLDMTNFFSQRQRTSAA